MAFAVVSLSAQHVSIYGADGLLARSAISTGQPGHRTPTGIFTILEKQRWHESNIYSGAPMPYMQRVTWSGIAMHEGVVPGYPASHGCIRLPAAFAAKLWTLTKPGSRVIVATEDLQPFEFAHPALPVPRLVPATDYPLTLNAFSPPPVTLASNDPEAATATELAAQSQTGRVQRLNPFQVAYALKVKAAADAADARKRIETAFADARAASAADEAAVAELGRTRAAVEQAQAALDAAEAILAGALAAVPVSDAAAAPAAPVAAAAPTPSTVDAARSAVARAAEELASARARFAAAKADEAAKSDRAYELAAAARAAEKSLEAAQDLAAEARRRTSPVNIVVSRKEGMVLIRQAQKAVYEAPVQIADPDKPLGTHIFVAIEESGDAAGLDWAAITAPDGGEPHKARPRKSKGEPVVEAPPRQPSGAEEALERITLPEGARARIAELLWVGGSLVITDRGLSNESGEETDLNVAIP